mgnify:CR=1 FL=1
METFKLSNLSLADVRRCVNLQERGVGNYEWTNVDAIELSNRDRLQVEEIQSRLLNYQTHLMNEATIWARGIYPLLLLAERDSIQAWAEVSLSAKYPQFILEGIADGILGNCVSGTVETPFLVVVEAKKGFESQNPIGQMYGQLLASARLNWEKDNQSPQEMFGCYTIADVWTFARSRVDEIDSDRPTMTVEFSREFVEKLEVDRILKILKGIVSRYLDRLPHLNG